MVTRRFYGILSLTRYVNSSLFPEAFSVFHSHSLICVRTCLHQDEMHNLADKPVSVTPAVQHTSNCVQQHVRFLAEVANV